LDAQNIFFLLLSARYQQKKGLVFPLLNSGTEQLKTQTDYCFSFFFSQQAIHKKWSEANSIPADLSVIEILVPLTSISLPDHIGCNAGNYEATDWEVFPTSLSLYNIWTLEFQTKTTSRSTSNKPVPAHHGSKRLRYTSQGGSWKWK
jgi:hypothetical protein